MGAPPWIVGRTTAVTFPWPELSYSIFLNLCSSIPSDPTASFDVHVLCDLLFLDGDVVAKERVRLLRRLTKGPMSGIFAARAPMCDSIKFHIATSMFDHVGSSKFRRIESTNWTIRVRQML